VRAAAVGSGAIDIYLLSVIVNLRGCRFDLRMQHQSRLYMMQRGTCFLLFFFTWERAVLDREKDSVTANQI
jgi:hypothetical protein